MKAEVRFCDDGAGGFGLQFCKDGIQLVSETRHFKFHLYFTRLLPLGNKNKQVYLFFCSLICTFAARNKFYGGKEYAINRI